MEWHIGVIITQLISIFAISGVLGLIWKFTHNKYDEDYEGIPVLGDKRGKE